MAPEPRAGSHSFCVAYASLAAQFTTSTHTTGRRERAATPSYTQVLPGTPGADVTAVTVRPASGSLPDTAAPSVTLTVSPSAAAATAATAAGQAQQLLLRVLAKVYYCQQSDVCLFVQIWFEVPLVLGGAAGGAASGAGSAGAASGASLRYEVVPAAQTSFVLQ